MIIDKDSHPFPNQSCSVQDDCKLSKVTCTPSDQLLDIRDTIEARQDEIRSGLRNALNDAHISTSRLSKTDPFVLIAFDHTVDTNYDDQQAPSSTIMRFSSIMNADNWIANVKYVTLSDALKLMHNRIDCEQSAVVIVIVLTPDSQLRRPVEVPPHLNSESSTAPPITTIKRSTSNGCFSVLVFESLASANCHHQKSSLGYSFCLCNRERFHHRKNSEHQSEWLNNIQHVHQQRWNNDEFNEKKFARKHKNAFSNFSGHEQTPGVIHIKNEAILHCLRTFILCLVHRRSAKVLGSPQNSLSSESDGNVSSLSDADNSSSDEETGERNADATISECVPRSSHSSILRSNRCCHQSTDAVNSAVIIDSDRRFAIDCYHKAKKNNQLLNDGCVNAEQSEDSHNDDFYLLPVSAPNRKAMQRAILTISENLLENRETVDEVTKRLQFNQTHHQKYRKAFIVSNDHTKKDASLQLISPQLNAETSPASSDPLKSAVVIDTESPHFNGEAFYRSSTFFRDSFINCCEAFSIESDPKCESIFHRASASYAMCRLMLKIGYHKGGVLSSGNDVLICCAALQILSLQDACHLYKVATNGNVKELRQKISKITLNESGILLKDIYGCPLDTVDAIFKAIQCSKAEQLAFLNIQQGKVLDLSLSNCQANSALFIIDSIKLFLVYIAKLYENGVDIEWSLLERVPPDKIHRIDTISPSCSPESTTFDIVLSDYPHLLDHTIADQLVLSAASQILLLKEYLQLEEFTFENVQFNSPIVFSSADEIVRLHLEETSNSDEMTTVNILHKGRICLNCSIRKHPPTEEPISKLYVDEDMVSKADFSNNYECKIRANEFYDTMLSYGYQHKQTFRSVAEVCYTGTEGTVRLTDSNHLDVMLDGAMQAIVYCHLKNSPKQNCSLIVPYHIDSITATSDFVTTASEDSANTACFSYKYSDNYLNGCLMLRINGAMFLLKGILFMPFNFSKILKNMEISESDNRTDQKTTLSSNAPYAGFGENFSHREAEQNTDSASNEDLRKDKEQIFEKIKNKSDGSVIAITSFACRLPSNVNDLAEFWEALKIGKNIAAKIPCSRISARDNLLSGANYGHSIEGANFLQDDIAEFDAEFFGISKSEAEKMDPQQRILLECVYECMENGGLKSFEDTGVYVGVMGSEYADDLLQTNHPDNVISMLGSSASVLSGRVNYVFDSVAPSVTIDTACSSSLVALNTAIGAILQNQCSRALVGGVNLMITERGFGQRANGRMLSEDGFCKTFDARADGYGRSDGCVVFLVERITDTNRLMNGQIYGVIDVSQINHDGRSASLIAPNALSQQKLIERSLEKVSNNRTPSYWEAHGTGTLLGDAIEMKSLNSALKTEDIVLGTAKTHVGHTEAAAGACALLKVALQMYYNYLPVHNHFMVSKNFVENKFRLPIVGEEWDSDGSCAGISSFGVSGTNAVAIVSSCSRKRSLARWSDPLRYYHIYPVSSKNKQSLQKLFEISRKMLTETSMPIGRLCCMAAVHREHFRYRSAILLKRNRICAEFHTDKHKVSVNRQYGIKFDLFQCSFLVDAMRLFQAYTEYRKRFLQVQKLLRELINSNTKFRSLIAQSTDLINIIHQCALAVFLYDLGIHISTVMISSDHALIAAFIFKSILSNESPSDLTGSSSYVAHDASHLPPSKMSFVCNTRISDWLEKLLFVKEWLKKSNSQRGKVFEWINLKRLTSASRSDTNFEDKLARLYVDGVDIKWDLLYESENFDNIIPNYQFNNHKYWHCERTTPFDDHLIGCIISEKPSEITFRNQLSVSNEHYLFNFSVNDTLMMPYGVCIEAVLKAVDRILLRKQNRSRYFLRNMSFHEFELPKKFWLTTKVAKLKPNECTVELCVERQKIASVRAFAEENCSIITKRLPENVNKLINLPNFYDQLADEDIKFRNSLQTITKASADGRVFKATPSRRCAIRGLADSMFQVLCFHKKIKSDMLYKEMDSFKQEIFVVDDSFHSCFIEVRNDKLVAYSPEGVLLSSISMDDSCSDDEQDSQGISQVASKTIQNTSSEDEDEASLSLNEEKSVMSKVRNAVEEILANGTTLDDTQLSTGFSDLGFDSLMITDLSNRLRQNHFPHLQLSIVDVFDYPNIRQLAKFIESKLLKRRTELIIKTHPEHLSAKGNQSLNAVATANLVIPKKDSGIHSETIESSEDALSKSISITDEDFLYVQKYFNCEIESDEFLLCLCDYQQGKRNAVIFDNANDFEASYNERMNTWTARTSDSMGIHKALSNLMQRRDSALIQFDFHSKFALNSLIDVLLALTSFLLKSPQQFTILSQPGTGRANAFAIGFSKSLATENYPRIQFVWNFRVERLNLSNFPDRGINTKQDSEENWLITGGLSGIGWQMAQWLINHRCISHIVLVGRRPLEESKHGLLNRMKHKVDVLIVSLDVSSYKHMRQFFKRLEFKLTGIIHSAGSTSDALSSRQTHQMFQQAVAAKCFGLANLQKLCDRYGHSPRHFILNSSVSAVLGNRGQCNYSAANALADEMMRERHANGLPATIINWGNWLETGMAVPVNQQLKRIGFNGLTTSCAMRFLKFAIEQCPLQVIVAGLNIDRVVQYRSDLKTVFASICHISDDADTPMQDRKREVRNELTKEMVPQNDVVASSTNSDVHSNKRSKEEIKGSNMKGIIVECFESICEMKLSVSDYDAGFMDLGLDSLKAYRFITELQERFNRDLSILLIFENPTINRLTQKLKSITHMNDDYTSDRDDSSDQKADQDFDECSSMISYNANMVLPNSYAFNIYGKSKKEVQEKVVNLIERLMFCDQPFLSQMRSGILLNPRRDCTMVLSVHAKSRLGIIRKLLAQPTITKSNCTKPVICFMFTGQGSQLWNMGRQLAETIPFFRKTLHKVLSLAQSYMPSNSKKLAHIAYEWSQRELLFATEYAQPLIFCFSYSLAQLLIHFGLKVDFFVGHSVSEIVAYAVTGMIELEDALRLVVQRGQALAALAGKGRMIVVNSMDVAKKLQKMTSVDIAAENSPRQIVLSGSNEVVERCLQIVDQNGYLVRLLDDQYPFHSSLIADKHLHQVRALCDRIHFKQLGRACLASNLSGKLQKSVTSTKIIEQIRSTVKFRDCVKNLLAAGVNCWVEIGNGEILSTLVRAIVNDQQKHVVCSAIRIKELEFDSILKTLLQFDKRGVEIDWSKVYQFDEIGRRLDSKQDIDMIIDMERFVEDVRFRGVDQHQLNGIPLIPAAFSIVLFANAVSGKLIGADITERSLNVLMKRVILRKPLSINGGEELKLKGNKFEMFLTVDGLTFSECLYSTHFPQMPSQIIVSNQFSRNARLLDHNEFYERLRFSGLQYGPQLNVIRHIRRTSDEISADLVGVESVFVLVDSALQVLAANVFDRDNPKVYIPFEIEKLWIGCDEIKRLDSLRAVGHIKDRSERFVSGDIDVYDQNEQLICAIRNVIAINKQNAGTASKNALNFEQNSKDLSKNGRNNRYNNKSIGERFNGGFELEKSAKNNERSFQEDKTLKKSFSYPEHPPALDRSSTETPTISIIGYAGQFPGSSYDTEALWNDLKTGTIPNNSALSRRSMFPDQPESCNVNLIDRQIECFDAQFFGISPAEACYIDPQQRLLLEMSKRVLDNAGLSQLPNRTGVFVATSSSDFAQRAYAELNESNAYLAIGTNQSSLAGRLAYWLNVNGPAETVDTACSSFATALTRACDAIRCGHCEWAMVGAVNIILNQKTTRVLENAKMLSPTNHCKVFDARADGYVRSEGVGMVLIKKLDLEDQQRFTGIQIKAYASGHNGRCSGITVPNGQRQQDVMRAVLNSTMVSDICFVEAHATGTRLGDRIEVNAICDTFQRDTALHDASIRLHSTKTHLGHCEAAAGLASFIAVLKSLENNYLLPNLHFHIGNDALNQNSQKSYDEYQKSFVNSSSDNSAVIGAKRNTSITNVSSNGKDRMHKNIFVGCVGEELHDSQSNNVLMNCFGFSGSNVSLLLSRSIRSKSNWKSKRRNVIFRPYIVILSAHDPRSLSKMKTIFKEYISETDEPLENICAYLQLCRTYYRFRSTAVLRSSHEEVDFIDGNTEKRIHTLQFYFDGKSVCMEDVLNLCENIGAFKKIFIDMNNNYVRWRSENHIGEGVELRIQFIAKLSLLMFFIRIGIRPTGICAKENFDRIVAEVFLRKAIHDDWCRDDKKSTSVTSKYHEERCDNPAILCKNTAISDRLAMNKYDCVINLNQLSIDHSEPVSSSKRLARLLAYLWANGVEINWSYLNDGPLPKCRLFSYPFNESRFWPFKDPELSKMASTNKDPSLQVSVLKSKLFDHSEVNLTKETGASPPMNWSKSEPSKFNKLMIEKPAQESSQKDKIIAEVDIFQEDFNNQCLTVIRIWLILDEAVKGNFISKASFNVFGISGISDETKQYQKSREDYICSCCIALLRSLASEKTQIVYRYIELDQIDDRILDEISSNDNFDEIIAYRNGQRYVERLQTFDLQQNIICNKKKRLHRIAITGGLGGIGRTLIKALRPKFVVILSRRTELDETARDFIESCKSTTHIKLIQGDCCNYEDVERLFDNHSTNPIEFVFHCAGTVENALAEQMDETKLKRVLTAKLDGTVNLIRICNRLANHQCKLVAFSSVASVLGSVGQTNYALANNVMECLLTTFSVNYLTINWGPWAEVGMLAGDEKNLIRRHIQKNGWNFLSPVDAIDALFQILDFSGQIMVFDGDFEAILSRQKHLKHILELLTSGHAEVKEDRNAKNEEDCEIKPALIDTIPGVLKRITVAETTTMESPYHAPSFRNGSTKDLLRNIIRRVSGVEEIDSDVGFMSVGIDSLMINEMRNILKNELELDIPVTIFYDRCTIDTMSAYIESKLSERNECGEIRNEEISHSDISDPQQIAIIAYSGALSGAANVDEFWQNLLEGRESITFEKNESKDDGTETSSEHVAKDGEFVAAGGLIPDIDKFDHQFWRISHSDAKHLDPQIRKFVEHAYIALEKCALVKKRESLKIGVIAAAEPTMYGCRGYNEMAESTFLGDNNGTIEQLFDMNQKDFVATWTSHLLNLRGPSFGVYSACSSGLLAVTQAVQLLRERKCEVVLVGASSLVLPDAIGHLYRSGMIFSPDGHCRPFDERSSGTVRGSVVGVIALRLVSDAIRDGSPILALLDSYAVNNDGKLKSSFTAPNISGQTDCLKEAIEGTDSADVEYVECHGTGTKIGDAIELSAMRGSYAKKLVIGSVKANIGHGFAGAGLAGLLKICKIVETRNIPKQINFTRLHDAEDQQHFIVPKTNIPIVKERFRVAVSSFGIGGTNAHVLLRNVDEKLKMNRNLTGCTETHDRSKFYLLPISGKTKTACIALCHAVAEYIGPKSDLNAIAYTLQNCREHFRYRTAVLARDIADAKQQLGNIQDVCESNPLNNDNIAFFFAPQGVQYARMGEVSLTEAPKFSESMRKCAEIISKQLNVDFWKILYPEAPAVLPSHSEGSATRDLSVNAVDPLKQQRFAQCALLSLCCSIVEQIRDWGIDCSTMIGHSVGEYSAAVSAEVFSLEDALRILLYRSKLISKTKSAKMIAVRNCPAKLSDGIEVSAVLSENFKCLVGEAKEIESFKAILTQQNIEFRELVTEYGFHSSFMDEIVEQFRTFLKNSISSNKPQRTILSNVDGKPITDFNDEYMATHMRAAVRLDKCLTELPSHIQVIVEIGPSGILQNLLKESHSSIKVIETVASRNAKDKRTTHLLNVVTKLWSLGYEINWSKVAPSEGNFDPGLPNYQFDKIVCWQPNVIKKPRSVRIFRRCWVGLQKLPSRKIGASTPLKSVLLFMPKQMNGTLKQLIIDLKNLFIECVHVEPIEAAVRNSSTIVDSTNGILTIDPSQENAYQQLGDHLRRANFKCSLVIHAWNMRDDFENLSVAQRLYISFYSHLWIKRYLSDICYDQHLSVISLVQARAPPEALTLLGPIRELHMTQLQSYALCLQISDGVDLCNHILHLRQSIWKPKFCYLRCDAENRLQEMSFCESVHAVDSHLFHENDLILIFGGCGSLGQAFIKFLTRQYRSLTFVIVSRNARNIFGQIDLFKKIQESSQDGGHCFDVYDIDMSDAPKMDQLIRNLNEKYQRINVVINAAGQVTSKQLHKSGRDVERVFASKIYGTRNIFDALQSNNCTVRGVLLTSTLSSILGINGNEDYAAANVFLDELAEFDHSYRSVTDNVISVQWSGWKDSTMIAEYASLDANSQVAKLIIDNSLSDLQYERVFFNAVQYRGCNAVSTVSPAEIVDQVARLQKQPLSFTEPQEQIAATTHLKLNEEMVKEIWKQCLGVETISMKDNFFHLGGHSLNGMQITWQINKQLGHNAFTINDLFKHPVLADFLELLSSNKNAQVGELQKVRIPEAKKLQQLKLTFAQENMLILRSLYEPTLYNIVFSIEIEGAINLKYLQYALFALIARQTSLRTVFTTSIENDQYWQECLSLTESYQNIDWSYQRYTRFESLIQAERSFIFELEQIPLRMIGIKSDSNKFHVIVSQHHIVTDGWSMSIFAKELSDIYKNFSGGYKHKAKLLPRLSRHIVDYAMWQRNEDNVKSFVNDLQLACDRLKCTKPTRLLTDHNYDSTPSFSSPASTSQYSFRLPPSLKYCLKSAAAQRHTTEYILMLSAFVCVVREFSDDYHSNQIVIGSAASGRQFEELNSIIGYFLCNIIVVIDNLKEALQNNQLIDCIEKAFDEAKRFEHLPFHRIVAALGRERSHGENPLFDIYFNYRHNLDYPTVDIPGTKTAVHQWTSNTVFDFSCTIDETPAGLNVMFDYNSEKYYLDTIKDFGNQYVRWMSELYGNVSNLCKVPIPSYNLYDHHVDQYASGDELNGISQKLCSTLPYHDVPFNRTVSDIIMQQSRIAGSAIAMEDGHAMETYETLLEKAICLACAIQQTYLRECCEPLRSDAIVPICVQSQHALLPIVAVLLVGAAYAPLDPQNPLEWNENILDRLKPSCVIASNKMRFNRNYPLLDPDSINHISPSKFSHKVRSTSESLAYVIYTSGSTGPPKGVCIAHHNLVHFLRFATLQIGAHLGLRVYNSVNTVFDISCANLFTSLTNASTLISCKNRLNAASEIVEKDINFAFLSSALFSQIETDQELTKMAGVVERLFIGGETPSREILEECLRRGVYIRQIYGPTETTVWSLTNRCTLNEGFESNRVIGTAMGNQFVVPTDRYGNQLSRDKVAELAITGDSVGRGYLSKPSDNFCENLHRSREDRVLNRNQILYRTGDRIKKKGSKYVYLGRLDSQMKIRGFRVEAIQIENAIKCSDDRLKNASITAISEKDNNSLIAFIATMEKLNMNDLKKSLLGRLPSYMVPDIFITIGKMPLNLSGKVDRKQLLKYLKEQRSVRETRQISNDLSGQMITNCGQMTKTELMIAQIWREVLHKPDLSLSDNFFVCGGHSLVTLSVCNRIQQSFAISLKPTDIFKYPTIESLSEFIDNTMTINKDHSSMSASIITMRNVASDSNKNLYLIHAVAGSIFPYYALLPSIPKEFSVYAIQYDVDYEPKTLLELAQFYVDQVIKHRKNASIWLMGHSLGGCLAREMAKIMQSKSIQYSPSFVVMLDSWCIGTEKLELNAVREYLEEQLSLLPNKNVFMERAMKLAKMLQNHRFESSDIKIHLFKAKKLENSASRRTISTVLQLQEKHEPVCMKMSKAKRKTFDSGKQRATGSDITINDVRNAERDRQKVGGTYPRPKTSWREKHETFVNAVSASRQVDYALKTGTPLPPPPKTSVPKGQSSLNLLILLIARSDRNWQMPPSTRDSTITQRNETSSRSRLSQRMPPPRRASADRQPTSNNVSRQSPSRLATNSANLAYRSNLPTPVKLVTSSKLYTYSLLANGMLLVECA
ncbi:unnamed protein product [Anisakis simplex]|uniref:Fatty acid synthase n=1 Tax=Anisakis simplex TaxID=6269 RepID=A0A3P6QMI8_ANISI|nr:unnamed protein product [Anisakis simplex]